MEWDEDGAEGDPHAPLLPPEDRLWRHPSEAASFAVGHGGRAGAVATATGARGAVGHDREMHVVTVVALTSCISVIMTMGVLAVVRPLKMRVAVERIATPVIPIREVSMTSDVADLAQRIRPAVVSVVAERAGGDAWGSGVIYRSDGMMLTSHHMVSGARSVRVVLDSGVSVAARLVGGDAETDVAVLDLEGDGFPTAPLGSRGSVKVGQTAITVGAAGGGAGAGGPSVRVSVISAMGQDVATDGLKLVDMMQTDAAVAPGCAGAPVVDRTGAVIGVATTNVVTDSGIIGYATPIDVVRSVADQLVAKGRVSRGWLGVDGDNLSATRATALGIRGGTVVRKVTPGGPAAAAGIVASDVITAIDDVTIATMSALITGLRAYFPGDPVSVTVLRNGQKQAIRVTLAERPT